MEANEYFHTVARQVKKITGADIRILNQLGGPPAGGFALLKPHAAAAALDQRRFSRST